MILVGGFDFFFFVGGKDKGLGGKSLEVGFDWLK